MKRKFIVKRTTQSLLDSPVTDYYNGDNKYFKDPFCAMRYDSYAETQNIIENEIGGTCLIGNSFFQVELIYIQS